MRLMSIDVRCESGELLGDRLRHHTTIDDVDGLLENSEGTGEEEESDASKLMLPAAPGSSPRRDSIPG